MKQESRMQAAICPDNRAPVRKGADYWYFNSAAVPLFNTEFAAPRRAGAGRKAVIYSIFARLFLAPMMLPHHHRAPNSPILEKQLSFLGEYEKAVELLQQKDKQALFRKTPGQRAMDLVDFLAGKASALDQEQESGYATKTSSYSNPKRYTGFFQQAESDPAVQLETCIQRVENLYTRQLQLIFQNDLASLARRLRYLASNLPGKGTFLLGRDEPDEKDILDMAGRILLLTLLTAAADKAQDGETYEMLCRQFQMPMPVNVGIAGKPVRKMVALPLAAAEQLCDTICREALSPATARALLPLLRAMPNLQQAAMLDRMQQEVRKLLTAVYMQQAEEQMARELDQQKIQQLGERANELQALQQELIEKQKKLNKN